MTSESIYRGDAAGMRKAAGGMRNVEGGRRKAEGGLWAHPVVEMERRGVPFTLNTDDPGLFQTTLEKEWELAAGMLGWFPEKFVELTRRTLQYSFLTEEEREQIRKLLM